MYTASREGSRKRSFASGRTVRTPLRLANSSARPWWGSAIETTSAAPLAVMPSNPLWAIMPAPTIPNFSMERSFPFRAAALGPGRLSFLYPQTWPESTVREYFRWTGGKPVRPPETAAGKDAQTVKTESMAGKTALITGATAGIGRVTARELAAAGARLLLVARSREKAEATREWIKETTGNSSIELIIADLSSQAGVRSAADQARSQGALNVLVNNVGAVFQRRRTSVDGIEMTFALNHLAPFLLTTLLQEALRRGASSRVVTVSSDAHQRATMSFDDLEGRVRYRAWAAYGQSKLANLLFTYELARRLEGSGTTANALHPGFVASEFGKNNGGFLGVGISIAQRLGAISVDEGARTSVFLASSRDVEGVTGKYFVKCREQRSSPASQDRESMRRLWEISEKMTALVADGARAAHALAE